MKKDSDLKTRILTLMRGPKYRPLDKIEFSRALGMKSDHRGLLKEALRHLEREGEIARIRKNRYVLPAEADLITGKLQIHQSGLGFLVRENSTEGDSFVPAANPGTALTGHRVAPRQRPARGQRRKQGRKKWPHEEHRGWGARCASSRDEGELLQGEHLAAHHARISGPPHGSQRDHHGRHARPHGPGQRDRPRCA